MTKLICLILSITCICSNVFTQCTDPLLYADSCDYDGDGVINIDDLDDDNDGILDTDEFCNSPAEPFTSLGMAQNVTSAGIYYFNLNGEAFSSYVDTDGYVQVAIDFGYSSGNLPQGTALNNTARGILSPSVLSNLTDATAVRITSTATANPLDVVTTNATILQRITTNTTLHQGVNDNVINDDWVGTGSSMLTADAINSSTLGVSLQGNVFHPSGNPSSLVWVPSSGYQRAPWSSGEIADSASLQLWVKAPAVALQGCNDLDNDNIPNHLDLDSDGDGCPDAIEGRDDFSFSDTDTSNIDGGNTGTASGPVVENLGNTVGNTPTTNGVPTIAGAGQAIGDSQNSAIQSTSCNDIDVDRVSDYDDLDNDNDGILDTDECSFTEFSGGTATQSSSITHSNCPSASCSANLARDGNTDGVFQNGSVTHTATEDNPWWLLDMGSAQKIQYIEVYNRINCCITRLDNFILEVLDASDNVVYTQTNGFSSDFNYLGNINTEGNKLRIRLEGDDRILSLAEVKVFVGECDTDGDGILDYLDLDSDNDGCPDALEGDAALVYTNLNSDGSINAAVNENGIPIATGVGATGNGTTGQADVSSKNNVVQSDDCDLCDSTSTLFVDSDNDNIGDECDLDDDNDGILDEEEDCDHLSFVSSTTPTGSLSQDFTSTYGASGNFTSVPGQGGSGNGSFVNRPIYSKTDDYLGVAIGGAYAASTFTATFNPPSPASREYGLLSLRAAEEQTIVGIDTNGNTVYPSVVYLESAVVSGANNNVYAGADNTNAGFVRFKFNTPITSWTSTSTGTGDYVAFRIYEVCENDTDNDGIINSLDLDSDGDGCFDTYEAGVPHATNNGSATDSRVMGPYTGNGLADTLQLESDTNKVNYTPTYSKALDSNDIACPMPLPVELLSFEATAIDNQFVECIWITATEINNDYFSLEKSTDGVNWEFVSNIKGAGNSNEVLSYEDIDYKPFNGVSYYRLKQTDFDGQFAYSNVVAVEITNESLKTFKVYPNPTKGLLNITGESINIESYKIWSIQGKDLTPLIKQVSRVGNRFQLDISSFSSGVYFLKLNNNKLIKINKQF